MDQSRGADHDDLDIYGFKSLFHDDFVYVDNYEMMTSDDYIALWRYHCPNISSKTILNLFVIVEFINEKTNTALLPIFPTSQYCIG